MRLPLVMILICYAVLLFTDFVIIRDLKVMSLYDKFKPSHKKAGKWWIVYAIFAILTLALLTVAISLPRRSEETGVTTIMWLLYIVLTIELSQLAYTIFSLLGLIPTIFRKRRWNTGIWVGLPFGALIFTMMWVGAFIGRYQIQTMDVEVSSPRLPKSFDGYKIAQISDIHLGTWGKDTTFVSKLVEKVNALHPDLIVFTGDAVNRESGEFLPFLKTLSHLHAPDGVLTILGNHDYGDYVVWRNGEAKKANLDSLKAYQKRAGWEMLDNSHKFISNQAGDSIAIIGVGNWGEPPFSTYGNLKKAYPESCLKDSNFKVLLSHNPEHWNREVSKISNIDLTLSGHTHAMQIMFTVGDWKWSPAKFRYDQWGGMYTRYTDGGEKTHIYVNIGAGEVGLPMRIGAFPEITLITLLSEKK